MSDLANVELNAKEVINIVINIKIIFFNILISKFSKSKNIENV